MKLRFNESQIQHFADRYQYPRKDTTLLRLQEKMRNAGRLTKHQLRLLAQWKAPRSAGYVESNCESYVREVTALAFSAKNERTRIETLTALDGVQWPTGSVILHLFHKDPYPILDFRALWSACVDVPKQYTFEFWRPYVEFCRCLARRNKVHMRVLDRALWQYSKENQPANP
jgi:hypothetical protein